jgi:hypothetical protein
LYAISSVKFKATISDRAGVPEVFSYTAARVPEFPRSGCIRTEIRVSLKQNGRGLYQRAGTAESDQNLLEIAYRTPRRTRCLITFRAEAR